ncbi:MAG: hypothetical protein KDA37_09575, partial [Planctomycetales bacterium]|nr:hypothetical protein [Planctomycetales bacterium]
STLSLYKQLVLRMLVKAFFMPLMFTYLVTNVNLLQNPHSITQDLPIVEALETLMAFMENTRAVANDQYLYDTVVPYFHVADVCFAAVGYALSLKLFRSHVRSAEPTGLGWTVALMCYQPFWGTVIGSHYLFYAHAPNCFGYFDEGLFRYGWTLVLLFTEFVFVWCTMCFGTRFSNLTHRGIVTFGPYYFAKHPAYIAKLVGFFMLELPVIVYVGESTTPSYTAGILALVPFALVCLMYYYRARTEEAHLRSVNDAYDIYCDELAARKVRSRKRS